MDNVDAKLSNPEYVLEYINQNRGLLWDKIKDFKFRPGVLKGLNFLCKHNYYIF